MTRLIDADNLPNIYTATHQEMIMAFEEAPTVEAEPVRHGHWVVHTDKWASGDEYFGYAECSECGDMFYAVETIGIKPIWDYCPSCGAKMDEVEE